MVSAAGGVAAILALVYGVHRYRLDRSLQWHVGRPITWKLQGAGLALLVSSVIVRSMVGSGADLPSLADVFVLAAYPCMIAGVLLMVRGRAPGQSVNSLLLGGIIAASTAFVSSPMITGIIALRNFRAETPSEE